MPEVFSRRSRFDATADEVFRWHARPGAQERLTPPWEVTEVLARRGTIRDGDGVTVRMRVGPFRVTWVAEHRDYLEGRSFRDIQVRGPFASWSHHHRIEPDGDGAILEDHIEYVLPGGWLGRAVAAGSVRRRLERAFSYRHRITADDLEAHAPCRSSAPLSVLVTGASGLIGGALVPFLTTGGHEVRRLLRGAAWDPERGRVEPAGLAGADAVVHLAGAGIAAGRWSGARKAAIRDSRTLGTRALAEALARLPRPPQVLVCASAIGLYGDRGDELLTEDSLPGQGFLAEVGREWEAAAEPARDAGIRVVQLRFGLVLSPRGGALGRMLLPFRLGVGGPLGSVRQWWSWIALDDVLGAIHHALVTPAISGPVNVVAPEPVTQADFARTLGRVLRRPAFAPAPAFALRLALGEMADALLLASTRVLPPRLAASGYRFRLPELNGALRHLLGRP